MNLLDLTAWVPALSINGLFLAALLLARKLLETRLTYTVKHEFDEKLEVLRTELRYKAELLRGDIHRKEADINALRSGVLSTMANRHMALDKRRVEAVDQLWCAVESLEPLRNSARVLERLNVDATAKEAANNEKLRVLFSSITQTIADGSIKEISSSRPKNIRPFVSPMVWSLFVAYEAVLYQAAVACLVIREGVGDIKNLRNISKTNSLLAAALPHHKDTIDAHGETAHYLLIDELQETLLMELQKMLEGSEWDKRQVNQASEIVALSTDVNPLNNQSEFARVREMLGVTVNNPDSTKT